MPMSLPGREGHGRLSEVAAFVRYAAACRMEPFAVLRRARVVLEVLVVDVGFQQSGDAVAVMRRDVEVCHSGGNEATVAFGQGDGADRRRRIIFETSGAVDADRTVSFETHVDDERVVFVQFTMKGPVDLQQFDDEELIHNDGNGFIDAVLVMGSIVGVNLIVESVFGPFGMQFARPAVQSGSVVVENPIGDIAGLLDFGQQNTAADGMDTPGRDIKNISGMNFMLLEDIADRAILDPFAIFVF